MKSWWPPWAYRWAKNFGLLRLRKLRDPDLRDPVVRWLPHGISNLLFCLSEVHEDSFFNDPVYAAKAGCVDLDEGPAGFQCASDMEKLAALECQYVGRQSAFIMELSSLEWAFSERFTFESSSGRAIPPFAVIDRSIGRWPGRRSWRSCRGYTRHGNSQYP